MASARSEELKLSYEARFPHKICQLLTELRQRPLENSQSAAALFLTAFPGIAPRETQKRFKPSFSCYQRHSYETIKPVYG